MIIDFRHGVVDYDISQDFLVHQSGNTVRLNVGTRPTIITVAHSGTDYIFEEPVAINAAWSGISISVATRYWLYWDFNQKTFERTFGFTVLEPIAQATPPTASMTDAFGIPALTEGRHWYDTNSFRQYVYTVDGMWREVLRVFAAQFHNGTFYSLSVNAPEFKGTQIGNMNVNRHAGRVVYDVNSNPIKRTDGTFLTTEDKFFVAGSEVDGVRLESNVHWALSGQTSIISKYSIVRYDQNGKVYPAVYDDTGNTIVGVLTQNTHYLEAGPVVLQGVVINTEWNWGNVGQPLWISPDQPGMLTEDDPHLLNPVTYPIGRVPVARVLSPTTVIFEQGLGGRGERGPAGNVTNIPVATQTTYGTVVLSYGPSDLRATAVVTNNDPRLLPRPYDHTHSAYEISFVPFGDIDSTNVQGAIEELEFEKVSREGDVMTGYLTLHHDPTSSLHAVTKQYVDALVNGLVWLDPICDVNLISDAVTDPAFLVDPQFTDGYIVPVGATGLWFGLDGHYVVWDGTSWLDYGLVPFADPSGSRLGVAMTSTTPPSGSFVGRKNQIAIFDSTGTLVDFEVPADNNAVYVCGDSSLNAYNQYAFNEDQGKWVLFGGFQTVGAGDNLYKVGTVLHVLNWSAGGTIDAKYWQGLEPDDLRAEISTNYSNITHNHDTDYSNINHNHDTDYADINHNHDTEYADINHNHDTDYSNINHNHDTEYADINHTHRIPYDISYFIAGVMVFPSMVVGSFVSPRSVDLPVDLAGSVARAKIAPATLVAYDIVHVVNGIGTVVGQLTFLGGSIVGAFTFATSLTLLPGECLEIVTPAVTEPTIKDISITIVGCSLAPGC